jgi:putative peptide zinc metalloprotease protein
MQVLDQPGSLPATLRLAEGVRLLGAYDSDGLTKPKYLAQRPDGQVALLSELLYITAGALDGSPLDLVATKVSEQSGRELGATEVAYLADKLVPLGLVSAGQAPVTSPQAAPILRMAGRAFLPPVVVRAVAWVLRPLFWPPVVAVFVVCLVAVDTWAFWAQPVLASLGLALARPALMLGILGLLALDTLWHEFGHATACRYGGGRPGGIGAGVYVMFPAFYTDVTDSYRLDRKSRLRVDLGGVYFNAIFITAYGLAWALTGYVPLLVVLAFSNLVIVQQLLPVVRMDGYWVLSDLVGVPDLFARIRPAVKAMLHLRAPADLTRRAAVIVSAWVAVVVPVLIGSMVLLLVHMPAFLARSYHSFRSYLAQAEQAVPPHHWAGVALAGAMMAFLLLPALGLGIVTFRTGRVVGTVAWVHRPFQPYVPRHMAPDPATFDSTDMVAYLIDFQARPHVPHLVHTRRPPRPPPRERRPTDPWWPKVERLEWWQVPPEPRPPRRRR